MGHYKSNLRDTYFVLFELLRVQDRLSAEDSVDAETIRAVLAEADILARGAVADVFSDTENPHPVFDPETHSVQLSAAHHEAYQALLDGEWQNLELPEALGGVDAPSVLRWSAAELFLGANPALYIYLTGIGFARILYELGTHTQRQLAQQMAEKRWTATMALTEADAGSDVGAIRATARHLDGETWEITGVKRFITCGEHDLAENIMHFVLARPVGAEPGTRGLSMFCVPKFLVTEDGELSERNAVYADRLESKMGLKHSTTCELRFSAARGYLVGDVHDGIHQMFRLIRHARMLVGAKSIATLSTGYVNAAAYARERVQGSDITQLGSPTAPRVTIDHHPDVQRSLDRQRAFTEGLRALLLYVADLQDRHTPDADAEVELLLPVVKGYSSERACEILSAETLQTFGGSGYLTDFPIEQYVRDAKIDTLYEGTTAIQAQDLFFRKIVHNQGKVLEKLLSRMEGEESLRQQLAAFRQRVHTMMLWMRDSERDPELLRRVGRHTSALLYAFGDLLLEWLLLRSGRVAETALERDNLSEAEQAFYEQKREVRRGLHEY